jgi:hypothetical protein
MTVELIYTILKVITAIIIIGIVGVIMVAGVTFIYSVFEDILKTNKNQTDGTVQFQDNIRPEEESQETQKTD